jgi:predicted ribosomally synthesized peptide with nif11-like leader
MSLAQLDAFLARVKDDPELQARVQNPADPLELADFLALARNEGFSVDEADVIAAQQRAEAGLSDEELQRRAGEEARRLRHFIPG